MLPDVSRAREFEPGLRLEQGQPSQPQSKPRVQKPRQREPESEVRSLRVTHQNELPLRRPGGGSFPVFLFYLSRALPPPCRTFRR